jgi:Na+/melibiose symporter-like transporter
MNRAGYGEWSLLAAGVMFASIMISCLGTHRFIAGLVHEPRRDQSWTDKLRQVVATLSNRSFLSLVISGIFGAVSLGMAGALSLYFNNYFWELTPTQLSLFQPVELLGALMAVVMAPILSRMFGKKQAMITLFVISTLSGNGAVVLRLMGLMPANHTAPLLPILLCLYLVTYSLGITGFILITSMMADVVEDAAVVTGQRSEGLLFAANGLINKCVTGVGTLLSGLLLAAISFPQHAIQGKVDLLILRHLGLAYVPIAVSCSLISIAVLLFYDIDRSTHERNVERLGMGVEPAETPLPSAASTSRAV